MKFGSAASSPSSDQSTEVVRISPGSAALLVHGLVPPFRLTVSEWGFFFSVTAEKTVIHLQPRLAKANS